MPRTPLDYLQAAVFALIALQMFRVSSLIRRAQHQHLSRDSSRLWLTLGLLFCLFGLTKALNLTVLLGAEMRTATKAEGLYDDRRPYQALAVGIILVGILYGSRSLFTDRHLLRKHAWMLSCVLIITAFALIRFISLHQIDAWLSAVPWLRPLTEAAASLVIFLLVQQRLRQLLSRLGKSALAASS